jgi:hypothetical protein
VVLSSEERQKLLETKQSQIQQIVGKQQFVEQCDRIVLLFVSVFISDQKLLDTFILCLIWKSSANECKAVPVFYLIDPL